MTDPGTSTSGDGSCSEGDRDDDRGAGFKGCEASLGDTDRPDTSATCSREVLRVGRILVRAGGSGTAGIWSGENSVAKEAAEEP